MLFSCKITNSVLTYFDQQGEDLSSLLESTTLPEEFLRDSSYWMNAGEMESFLSLALSVSLRSHQNEKNTNENLFEQIGHTGPELRAWGVLDSVLRMMPRPQEILAQPERFLSYFISPAPPIDNLVHSESGVAFDLPISADQYPLVTRYLKSAFESLPLYVGQPQGVSSWKDIHLKITWNDEQSSIFADADPGRQISPELLRSIVISLEKHQRELEEKNKDLQAKNEQLLKAQAEMEKAVTSALTMESFANNPVRNLDFIDESSINALGSNFSKLSDYMVRAQQLIIMLVGQNRMNPAIKEAMRRTDWERVKTQFPLTVKESIDILEKTKTKFATEHQEKNHV